jgi:hypothetical protein
MEPGSPPSMKRRDNPLASKKAPIKPFTNHRKSLSHLIKHTPPRRHDDTTVNVTSVSEDYVGNKGAMLSAVQYCSFGGTLSAPDLKANKKELTEIINQIEPNIHLIALLKPNKFNTRLDLKALYTIELPSAEQLDATLADKVLTKVWGKTTPNQPVVLDLSLVQKYYRFN